MAGLVPKRRTRDELEQANAALLDKHRDHLKSWIAEKTAKSTSNVDTGEAQSKAPPLPPSQKR